jgi:tetratricopeptide (TPR) repeat protein
MVMVPWLAEVQARLGECEVEANPSSACARFAEAGRLAPWRDDYWCRLANACERAAVASPSHEGRRQLLKEGLQALDRTVEFNPTRADNHANRARALTALAGERLVEPEQVLAAFDEALARDPLNTCILGDAGRSAVRLGKCERGKEYLETGMSLDPDLATLQVGLGELAALRGQLPEARDRLQEAFRSNWHGNIDYPAQAGALLALVELRLGNPAQALVHADAVIRQQPRWPGPRLTRAQALEQLGRADEARGEFRSILARWPEQPRALEGIRRLNNAPVRTGS